jgi:hypothetical protein
MEFTQLLAATGIFGIVLALVLVSVFLLIQPVWAIIDCVDSERQSETKVLVSVALLCTWGLGGIFYGIFFADSRNLRKFTLVTLALFLLLGAASIGSCTLGAIRSGEESRKQAEVAQQEAAVAIREFRPPPIAPDALDPFPALLMVGGTMSRSAAVADFTLAGPELASARDVSERIRHVAAGPDGLFAITDHDFGAISPATGRLVKIALDPSLEEGFSWPKGLAFDGAAGKLVIVTTTGGTRFYRYDPRTAAWERLPAEPRTEPLRALAWLPEDGLLYSLELPHRANRLERIQRFNAQGANLGSLPLAPPIPLPPGLDQGFQLLASSGRLVLMIPPGGDPTPGGAATAGRIFAIDPATGAVLAPGAPPGQESDPGAAEAGARG